MRILRAANCSGAAGIGCNSTTAWDDEDNDNDSRDEYLAYWEVATLALMFVVAIAGNSLVVMAIYLRRRDAPRKNLPRIYFFILHLSTADLLTALLNVLPQLAWKVTFRFRGGPVLCKFVKFGQPLGLYLSSYVMTATALDRYQAVCHPLAYCSITSRRSKASVWFAWCLSLALCVPQTIVFSYRQVSPGVRDCWATFHLASGQRAYVTWYGISAFILPLTVLVYTYASICIAIWRNAGMIAGEAGSGTHGGLLRQRAVISRAKINSVRQMIAVISFYAASSSPFIASSLWVTWDPDALTSPFFSGAAFTILALMSSLNSCVNPWIYLTLNTELSRALMNRVRVRASRGRGDHEHRLQSRQNRRQCKYNDPAIAEIARCSSSNTSSSAGSILRRSGNTSDKELQPSIGAVTTAGDVR